MAQVPAQLGEKAGRRLLGERRHFEQLARRLQTVHPRRQWAGRRQQADELQLAVSRCAWRQLQKLRAAWRTGRDRLARVRPGRMLALRRERLQGRQDRLGRQARLRLENLRQRAASLAARLQLLGPEQVLARGYSITRDAATGRILRDAAQTAPGQNLRTRLKTGEVSSTVTGR